MSFYVNFSIDNNPTYQADDPSQPMGWFDFVSASANTYYCRGIRDDAARILYLADKHLKPWSLSAYGPWRFNAQTLTGTVSSLSNNWSLSGGIVSANNMIIQGAGAARTYNFYNVHFILSNNLTISSILGNAINIYFKGSILRCDSINVDGSTPISILDDINFRDSIVIVNSNTNRGNDFVNSVFNRPLSAWNNASIIDCQFNFIPPTWPMWNAIKDAWKYSDLGVNISISATGDFTDYEQGLFGNLRSTAAGIGAFFFDVNNYRLLLVQKVDRHVIKRLDSNIAPAIFDGQYYGIYKESGRLKYPQGVATDGTKIFLCDYKNSQIICFDKELNFIYSHTMTVNDGKPYLALCDQGNLYVLRVIANFWNMKLEKLQIFDDRLESSKISGLLGKMKNGLMPTGLCKGFFSSEFYVSGLGDDIFKTLETISTFTAFSHQYITGADPIRYTGIIKHSNGYVYLNNGEQLIKIDSAFENIGDSNFISKVVYGLKEVKDETIMTYNVDDQSILRYNANMNFVEQVFKGSTDDIASDAYDVVDFIEVNLVE